ncbi:MAG: LAGLIDADG family homing endonuclease [Candidatus Aenigmatarchaeota archaeon]
MKLMVFPSKSEKLAEFLGIMAGDGSMAVYRRGTKTDYRVIVSGDSRDDAVYLTKHVHSLVKELFGLEPTYWYQKSQHTMHLVIRSKLLLEYLSSIGVNVGRKINMSIPEWILEKRIFILAYLKGLFDTDGGIYLRNGTYPVVSLAQKSRKLVESVEKQLKANGFTVWVDYDIVRKDPRGFVSTGHRLYISGKKNLGLWNKHIGFSNPKHASKLMVG